MVACQPTLDKTPFWMRIHMIGRAGERHDAKKCRVSHASRTNLNLLHTLPHGTSIHSLPRADPTCLPSPTSASLPRPCPPLLDLAPLSSSTRRRRKRYSSDAKRKRKSERELGGLGGGPTCLASLPSSVPPAFRLPLAASPAAILAEQSNILATAVCSPPSRAPPPPSPPGGKEGRGERRDGRQ